MKVDDLVPNLEQKIKYYNAGGFDIIDANGDIINCVQMDYDNKTIRLLRKDNANLTTINPKNEQLYFDDGGAIPSIKDKPVIA